LSVIVLAGAVVILYFGLSNYVTHGPAQDPWGVARTPDGLVVVYCAAEGIEKIVADTPGIEGATWIATAVGSPRQKVKIAPLVNGYNVVAAANFDDDEVVVEELRSTGGRLVSVGVVEASSRTLAEGDVATPNGIVPFHDFADAKECPAL